MPQMTWRPSDDLLQRVRHAADRAGRSMNDYVSAVLDAATDPALAGGEAERLRARLDRAGLLVPPGRPRRRPPADRVEPARAAAGRGTPLAQLVSRGR
ncbi:MAG: transcriptional regulator [Acidimicrobiales bacterium]